MQPITERKKYSYNNANEKAYNKFVRRTPSRHAIHRQTMFALTTTNPANQETYLNFENVLPEVTNYGENVRPVRARKKGRKMRRERERETIVLRMRNWLWHMIRG